MAKRPTKKPPKREAPTALVSASITYAETASRYGSQQQIDRELVARGMVNAVYSACNMNAVACAAQPIRLYRKAGKTKAWNRTLYPGVAVKDRRRLMWLKGQLRVRPGRKALAQASTTDDIEEVLNHPALDLLYAPDPGMPASAWWWLLYFFGEAAGRCYLYKGERVAGVPASLYLLAPQYTRVEADKRLGITGYAYSVEVAVDEVRYVAADVVYYRQQPNPFRPLQAASWLSSVRLQSDLEQAAIQSEIARWNNGGNPSMVLELSPEFSPEQVDAIRSRMRAEYTGVNKTGNLMVLQNAKLMSAGQKPNEMQYIEGGRRSEELIYRAAGIPEPMWKMNDANRASAGQADPQYMGQTVLPRLNGVAETLTEGLLMEYPGGEEMWFAYDNPVAEDRAAEVLEVTTLSDKGLITGNEARSSLGYEKAGEELDVLRYAGKSLSAMDAPPPSPFGAPNAQAGQEAGQGRTGSDAGNPGSGDGDGNGGAAGSGGAETGGEDAAGGGSSKDRVADSKAHGSGAESVPELTWAKGYDHACTCGCGQKAVAAVGAEAALTRYMEDWYSRAIGTIGPDGRPNLEGLMPELERNVSRMMTEIFASGGNAMAEQIAGSDASFSVTSDEAVRYVNERAGKLVTGITETVREQVQNATLRAVADGTPLSEIQGQLRDAGFAENRAEVVARTETITAYNAGQFQAAKDSGVAEKTYEISGNPCELCMAIHAAQSGPIPMDQPFAKAGQVYAGVTLTQDVMFGVVHPQCSCGFSPVLF